MRELVMEMEPYAWEASSLSIAREQKIPEKRVVRFDMNTNPYVPQAVLEEAGRLDRTPINEYPAPDYDDLLSLLAAYAGVEKGQIVPGAGADEVIDTIAKAFLEPGKSSVISVPTYSMFRIASRISGAKVIEIPRASDFSLDLDALESASKDASVVWVCNPNSPNGNAEPLEKIRDLVQTVQCPVVVDEAYAEFWGKSAARLIGTCENLVVLRTLSKSFGLAGARVGYALCGDSLALQINKVRPPCSISSFSARLAKSALSAAGIQQVEENLGKLVAERGEMKKALEVLDLFCYPSEANFLLVNFGTFDADVVFKKLLSEGLVVRNLSKNPLTRNCLRITVRAPAENARLLIALQTVLS